MIFDTHAHYDDEAFDEDRDRVLMGLKEAGVGTVLNVGASMASSESTLALTEQYPFGWIGRCPPVTSCGT